MILEVGKLVLINDNFYMVDHIHTNKEGNIWYHCQNEYEQFYILGTNYVVTSKKTKR
jgi:hypothetical protein